MKDETEQFKEQFIILRKMMARPDSNMAQLGDEIHGLVRKIGERLDEPDLEMHRILEPFSKDSKIWFDQKNSLKSPVAPSPSVQTNRSHRSRASAKQQKFDYDPKWLEDVSNAFEVEKTWFSKFDADGVDAFEDQAAALENYDSKLHNINEQAHAILNKNGIAGLRAREIEKQLDLERENLGNCESMMEQLGRDNCDENDLQDLKEFDEQIERAQENLEDYRSCLKQDDRRAKKLLQELQDERIKLSEARLKLKDAEFENLKGELLGQNAAAQLPDETHLRDLRERLRLLKSSVSGSNDRLSEMTAHVEDVANARAQIEDELNDLLPNLHEFKRRPEKKIRTLVMAWNDRLEGIVRKVDRHQERLKKVSAELDETQHKAGRLESDINVQQYVFDDYIDRNDVDLAALALNDGEQLEQSEEANEANEANDVIVDKMDQNGEKMESTRQGALECRDLMEEMNRDMTECNEDMSDSRMNLRTQQLSCFKLLERVNELKEVLVRALPKPLPELPRLGKAANDANGEDLHKSEAKDGFEPVEALEPIATGAVAVDENELELLEETRVRLKDDYETALGRELAGLTTYDSSERIDATLMKIQSVLAAVSPLHFYTVSNYLYEPLGVVEKELKDLISSFRNFLKIQSMAQIGMSSPHSHENSNENMVQELKNYQTQCAQDLAADYHYTSQPQILEENINLIERRLEQITELRGKMDTVQELEYLRKMYKSFLDPVYPQPIHFSAAGANSPRRKGYNSNYSSAGSSPDGRYQGKLSLSLRNGANGVKAANRANGANAGQEESLSEEPSYHNNDGIRVETTKKEQFRTSLGYQFAGRSVNDTTTTLNEAIEGIDKYLFGLRGEMFPLGFNVIYQDAMLFGTFPGDDPKLSNKVEFYASSNNLGVPASLGGSHNSLSPVALDAIGLASAISGRRSKRYAPDEDDPDDDGSGARKETIGMRVEPIHNQLDVAAMSKDERSKLIQELMELEWEYTELLVNREDDTTQSDLYERLALYYRRLFSEPLDDIYLEEDRTGLLNDVQSYQMQTITMQRIASDDNAHAEFRMMHTLMHQTQGVNVDANMNNNGDIAPSSSSASANPVYADQRKILEKQFDRGDAGLANSHLKDILESHQRFEEGIPIEEQVNELCREADNWENKYKFVSKKNKELQFDKEKLSTELENAVQERDAFEDEMRFLRQFKGTNDGTAGRDPLTLEELDILQQIRENLNDCYEDAATSKLPGKSLLSQTRQQLRTMRQPLDDLAKDFDSAELTEANDIIARGVDQIKRQEKGRDYNKKPLLNNIKDMIDEIDGIIEECNQQLPEEYNEFMTPMGPTMITPGQTVPMHQQQPQPMDSINVQSGDVEEMEMKYPELMQNDSNNNQMNQNNPGANERNWNEPGAAGKNGLGPDQWPRQKAQFKQFDDNFPAVVQITIEGSWIKKYPLCHIEFDGARFTRKMKHFNWLWRMLLLDARADRPVPDYPTDLPESMWPQGYLRRRKRELNLFLMNCHATEWIKKHKAYYQVFLAATDAKFKQRKKEFDSKTINKAKESIAKAKQYEKKGNSKRAVLDNANSEDSDMESD